MRADTIRLLADKGLSLDDIIEVAESEERRSDPTAAERKRRQRAREKNSHGVTVTRDMVSPNEELLTPSEDSPVDASASTPPRQPVTEAFGIFTEVAAAVGWRVPGKLSPARQRALSNRLREHGLDGWRACIARARASPYLAGADPPQWFTFDWLTKSGNFLKVQEGNYDRRHTDSSDPTAVALARLHAQPSAIGAVG